MPSMARTLVFTVLSIVALGCHHEKPTTTPGDTTSTPTAGTGGTVDPEMVAIAAKPGVATKFKIRVDAQGALAKQSLYHGDANAIPASVRTLAEKRWAGGKIVSFETELYAEHGRVHEVQVTTAEGGKCELAVKSDGTELYEECVITTDKIPQPVAAKVAELFPDGKILEAETKKGAAMDELTIEVEVNGHQYYLRVKPDGTVIAKLLRLPAVLEVPVD